MYHLKFTNPEVTKKVMEIAVVGNSKRNKIGQRIKNNWNASRSYQKSNLFKALRALSIQP